MCKRDNTYPPPDSETKPTARIHPQNDRHNLRVAETRDCTRRSRSRNGHFVVVLRSAQHNTVVGLSVYVHWLAGSSARSNATPASGLVWLTTHIVVQCYRLAATVNIANSSQRPVHISLTSIWDMWISSVKCTI